MAIDPSSFHLHNITDTCGVWNVLSSRTLYSRARGAGVVFICTGFVLYECLFKPRKTPDPFDEELRSRFRAAQRESAFDTYSLDITDLQTIEILENRKRLGKGELSSIAFAMKTRQAFLTDDQKARRLARDVLRESIIQTTPHLVGWLFFTNRLVDADKSTIIKEHQEMRRPLAKYFEQMYLEACRCRLMANQGAMAK
jgi:predicted nucleic acid-binding protein